MNECDVLRLPIEDTTTSSFAAVDDDKWQSRRDQRKIGAKRTAGMVASVERRWAGSIACAS